MSAIDPFVADPDEDNLTKKVIRFTAPAIRPTRFTPDPAAQTGELFILALCYEGLNASTAAREKRLFFPVNPDSFTWTQTRAVGTYDILNGPQATQLGNMQIRVFHLTSHFPQRYDPEYCIPYPRAPAMVVSELGPEFGMVYPAPDNRTPQDCVIWIMNAMRAGYPLQFTAIPQRRGQYQPPSIFPGAKVVISSFAPSYNAGNPLDVFFELELTELVEPTIIKTTTTSATAAKHVATKYTTKKGDSLILIARHMYGKKYPNFWVQIKRANGWVYYPKHVRHHLRNYKGKTSPLLSTTKLLPGQSLVIPPPTTKKK